MNLVETLRQWALTLGGAALLCGLAAGLIPGKAFEREIKLILTLVVLLSFFTMLTKVDLAALAGFTVEQRAVQAAAITGGNTLQESVLFVTEDTLARTLEQDLQLAYGREFPVQHIVFGGQGEELVVDAIVFSTLNQVEEDEMSRYLYNRFGLSVTVSEVGT